MALDREFLETRRQLKLLLRQARYKPDSLRRDVVKSQLELINALIRLIKEESAFFLKLGRLYDFISFIGDFIELLKRRDPKLAHEIIKEMDVIWTRKNKELKT